MKISAKLMAVLIGLGVLSGCANKHDAAHYALCATAGGIAGGLITGAAGGDSDDAGVGIAAGAAIATVLCPANHQHEQEPVCPSPAPQGALLDANGCAFDSDNDGVVDGLDQCPGTASGIEVNAKGCPLDSDGDGVLDHLDNCPNTPAGTKVDMKGCGLKTGDTIVSLTGIQFETNSAELTMSAKAQLDTVINVLKEATNVVSVKVEGHTDNRGSAEYNQKLSLKRAESVIDYLVSHGKIYASKLTAVGMGETDPIASNATDEGRAQNRRVDFVVDQVEAH